VFVTSGELVGAAALSLNGSGGTLDITGNGDVAGDITQNIDLTGVGSSIALTMHGSLSGSTLTLTGTEANGLSVSSLVINGHDSGTVAVKGALAGGVDLTHVLTNIDLTHETLLAGSTANTFASGGNIVSIGNFGAGQSLLVTAAEANNLILTGAGTLVLEGSVSAATYLGGVTTNIDLTLLSGTTVSGGSLSNGGNALVLSTLQANQVLSVKAAELTGGALSLSGSSSSELLITTNVDTGAVDLTFVSAPIVFSNSNEVVSSGATLAMTSAGATGQTISGAGSVSVYTPGGSVAAFDLSHVTTATETVIVNSDAILSASTDLGQSTNAVSVGSGVALQADVSVLSGHTVSGNGGTLILLGSDNATLDLSHLAGISTVDLQQVTGSLTGTQGIFATGGAYAVASVADNQTYDLTAAQLSGNGILASGTNHTGIAHVLSADVTVSYNFSHLTPFSSGVVDITFTNFGILDGGTDLHGFNAVYLHAGTTSMTAIQANNISNWAGAGNITVSHGLGDTASAVLNATTAGGDTFNGHGTNDTVNLGTTANETLGFSGLGMDYTGHGNGDFTVNGFNFASDSLDFSSLPGHQSAPLYIQDVQIYGGIPTSVTNNEVLVFTDFEASGARAVQNLFTGGNNHLNNILAAAHATSEILFIDDGSGSGTTHVWLWNDSTGGDNKVQQTELKDLGSLNSVSVTDLQALFPVVNNIETTHLLNNHIIG